MTGESRSAKKVLMQNKDGSVGVRIDNKSCRKGSTDT